MGTRILMVGLGSIGQRHLRNVHALLGTAAEYAAYRVLRQVPIISPTMQVEKTGPSLEERYNLTVFDDLDAALGWKPTAVFISNPSSLHVAVAVAAARAGAHLFIEKPLSHNLEQVDELCAILDERKLVGMVAYQMRFHPCLRKAHELLRAEAIGKTIGVRADVGEYLPDWHPWEDYRTSYAARADLGGGVILTQIHEFDYLYSMFGLPQKVYTIGGKFTSLEINVEDTASTLMDYAGIPVHLHQDFIQKPPKRSLEIIGDVGRIYVDLRATTVSLYRRAEPAPQIFEFPGFDRNEMFLAQTRHFLDCIKTGAQPIVNVRDGAQSLRMALAAKESLAKGVPVYL